MPLYEKPHVGHDKHLCTMVNKGASVDDYKKLVTNARFVCKQCGRAAAKDENLCDPAPL